MCIRDRTTFAAMENHRTDSIPNDSYPVKSDRLLGSIFAGGRIAPQGQTIFRIGNSHLHALGLIEFFVDPARFLDHPMYDHGAARCGERPFYQRREQNSRHDGSLSAASPVTLPVNLGDFAASPLQY